MPDILPYTKIIKFSGAKEPHIRHDKLRSEKKGIPEFLYHDIYTKPLSFRTYHIWNPYHFQGTFFRTIKKSPNNYPEDGSLIISPLMVIQLEPMIFFCWRLKPRMMPAEFLFGV